MEKYIQIYHVVSIIFNYKNLHRIKANKLKRKKLFAIQVFMKMNAYIYLLDFS
jgi:hypothetical protein